MKLHLLGAAIIVLLLTISGWAADSYYVYDGNNLYTVFDSPENAHYDKWAAFYFRRGASVTVLSQRWGMDLEDSPDAVLRSIEKNQQFEKRYEKWCGCSWGPNTFFNPAAPVAMAKGSAVMNARQLELLAKLHTGWDKVDNLITRFNTAATLAGEAKLPRLQYKGPFSEYMDAMHSAIDQFMKINHELTQYSDAALNSLQAQLAKFMDDTDHAVRVSDAGLGVLTERFSPWTPATTVSNQATTPVQGQYQVPCTANPDCQTALPGSRCIATRCQLPALMQSRVEYRWETAGIARCAVEFRATNQPLPGNPQSVEAVVVTDAGSREAASVTLWAASPELASDAVDNCTEVKSVTIREIAPMPAYYVGVHPLFRAAIRDPFSVYSNGEIIYSAPNGTLDISAGWLTAAYAASRFPAWTFREALAALYINQELANRKINEASPITCSTEWGWSIDVRPHDVLKSPLSLIFNSEAECKGIAFALYKEIQKYR